MPRENRKRGRRGEATVAKKRKYEDAAGGEGEADQVDIATQSSSKRRRSADEADGSETAAFQTPQDASMDDAYPAEDRPFYGMLDEEEQEYFKRADEMLEMNEFGDPEERKLFLENVYREADGKELKLANSQSCSRLLERLIQLSTPSQLKTLFQRFSGNFIHLMSHRFASHCLEQLLTRAAPYVSDELSNSKSKSSSNGDGAPETLEKLFLQVIDELKGSMGFVMIDRFASHVFRTLLLVLSGQGIESGASKSLLASKKKEGVSVNGIDVAQLDGGDTTRKVPHSFAAASEGLINDSVAGLDVEKLRSLAVHPNASPVLQLLLQLELSHFGKQHARDSNSIYKTLLPDEQVTEDNDSGKFLGSLIYDPVGSHLVEMIVKCTPGKVWKGLYRSFFKERLGSFARNEIAGYVVCIILERLGKDDLLEAHERVVGQIPSLLERGRTVVVRTLIERCAVRDIDTRAIAVQIDRAFLKDTLFDIERFLQLDNSIQTNGGDAHDSVQDSADGLVGNLGGASPAKVHFNVLAQAMIVVPGPLSALIIDSLMSLDSKTLLRIAKDNVPSRTLQAALSSKNASVIQTRKLVQHFYGHIGDLALDKSASHVVDKIWEGTHGLAFIRERIAEELAENEAALRNSPCGRGVWKNWKMDMYKRRRVQWVKQSNVKASNDGFQSFSELDKSLTRETKPKTPLELARERHANKAKADQSKPMAHRSDAPNLCTAVKDLIVPFVRAADQDAAVKGEGHGLQQSSPNPRTTLVEHLPPTKLNSLLQLPLQAEGTGRDGLLSAVQAVLQYSVNTWDQGFMDKLYAAPTPVGVTADMLLSALNTNLHVYQVSPALTVIEKQTAKALAEKFGFKGPYAGGISQPGGSAANQSSIVIARNNLFPETKSEGNGSRKFVLFTSAHGHYSLEKAAQMFGFGSNAVRSVPVDKRGCIVAEKLDALIEKAKADGETPFYVNATAGTTVLGSYDPLHEIADICQKHKVWMHVDGSWGSPVVFSEKQKHKVAGIERADSIALCPHKMMGIGVTCSFLLGKDMRQFHKGMTLPAGYLFHNPDEDEETQNGAVDRSAVDSQSPDAHPNVEEPGYRAIWDLADLTPQCGRRGDSLKLALTWVYYGSSGIKAYIDNAFDMAAYMASLIESNPKFTLISENPPPCLQVCFYFDKQSGAGHEERNSKITEKVSRVLIHRGFMIDYAPGEDGRFFRVVVNNQTRRPTVDGLVAAIEDVGSKLTL
ncbi:PLP-dependent transferase [Polychaeton citri CBS 116435]|uniref:PLP-dependent transferase n=1 Tax=Polychaeton citri CBS 116435 TaxID=1314669 RepID=A0A9P4QD55_9PEZI|nr:PLP-dependent transferase [Polychaeton citri CBS 116435]